MNTSPITPDLLVTHLRCIRALLATCVRRAFAAYQSLEVPPELKSRMQRGPEGITLWHYIWHYLEGEFAAGAVNGFKIVTSEGLPVLYIESLGAGIRVNKLDPVSHEGPLARGNAAIYNHPQLFFLSSTTAPAVTLRWAIP